MLHYFEVASLSRPDWRVACLGLRNPNPPPRTGQTSTSQHSPKGDGKIAERRERGGRKKRRKKGAKGRKGGIISPAFIDLSTYRSTQARWYLFPPSTSQQHTHLHDDDLPLPSRASTGSVRFHERLTVQGAGMHTQSLHSARRDRIYGT